MVNIPQRPAIPDTRAQIYDAATPTLGFCVLHLRDSDELVPAEVMNEGSGYCVPCFKQVVNS